MTLSDWALTLRSVILAGLMVAAVLAPLNAWSFARHHRGPQDARRRAENVLKAVSVATFGSSMFYSVYTHLDVEFNPGLPGMALGLVGYNIFLFLAGNDHEPDPKSLRSFEAEVERVLNER